MGYLDVNCKCYAHIAIFWKLYLYLDDSEYIDDAGGEVFI